MSLWNAIDSELLKISGMHRPSADIKKILGVFAKYQYSRQELETLGMGLAAYGSDELIPVWESVTIGINKGMDIQRGVWNGRSQSELHR